MRAYRITGDVTGDAYQLLLAAALREAATFALVWRDQLQFGATAAALRDVLRRFQLRQMKSDRWPGTVLLGQYASVISYRAAPEALATLLEPGSLFAWRAPAFPEDLSFTSNRETVCLATISHEATAWILSESLASAVRSKVTLVAEILEPGDEEHFKPT
jgi:hypothetical protein